MFNGWYFFWLILSATAVVGLYFLLKNKSEFTQKAVLFGLLSFGLSMIFDHKSLKEDCKKLKTRFAKKEKDYC